MVVFPYEQIYSVTWIVLCGLFLHWLFPREPFVTGVALAFHLSQIHSVILWSPFPLTALVKSCQQG